MIQAEIIKSMLDESICFLIYVEDFGWVVGNNKKSKYNGKYN